MTEETITRASMVFYRSFFDAVKNLPEKEFKQSVMALLYYGLDGKEPEEGDVLAQTIFVLSKPQIDKNNQRYLNGKNGGRRPNNNQNKNEAEPNDNQSEAEAEPNTNQRETEVEPSGNQSENQTVTEVEPSGNQSENQTVTEVEPSGNQRENQTVTKPKPNVNDNDNVNVNDNVNAYTYVSENENGLASAPENQAADAAENLCSEAEPSSPAAAEIEILSLINKTNCSKAKPSSRCQPIIELILADKAAYPVYQEDADNWGKLYPNVDIIQQLRNMKGWLEGNPSRRKTKAGMPKFINAWLIKEQNGSSLRLIMPSLPSVPSEPPVPPKNKFINYEQREWDYDELERIKRKELIKYISD